MEGTLGYITLFAGKFAPTGWLYCNGQELAVTQYQALFSVIGTTYGGDASNNFYLPDLRGRAIVGVGEGPGLLNYPLASKGGVENTMLNNTMINHDHQITMTAQLPCNSSTGGSASPVDNVYGVASGGDAIYSNVAAGFSGALIAPVTTTPAGTTSTTAVETRSPYLALNYIICVEGTYPPRP